MLERYEFTKESFVKKIDGNILINLKSLFGVLFHFQHHTIKHFAEHLKIIKMISKEIQNKINKSIETKHLVQMFNLVPWYIAYGFFAIAILCTSILLSFLLNKYDERWRR